MDFYCITFYALIDEALILDGYEYSVLSNIALLPYMKKPDARKVLESFRKLGQQETQSDILRDRERLRRILKGGK